jgi:hypothetical protein
MNHLRFKIARPSFQLGLFFTPYLFYQDSCCQLWYHSKIFGNEWLDNSLIFSIYFEFQKGSRKNLDLSCPANLCSFAIRNYGKLPCLEKDGADLQKLKGLC